MRALAAFDGLAWVAAHPWLYPALVVVHVVGVALLFGSLVLVELRLWGFARELPLRPFARFGLGLTWAGFGAAVASGVVLFLSQPADLLGNRAFLVKMALIAAAGLNAGAFHALRGLERAGALARAQTTLSLGLWLAIIICGRWIAYD
ncbi:hypothetical protein [Piscinibacter koreensis]|uniref:DUF2214 domain-containing protein n=1 Tax=Piscinibacter koreensis TaxID=2742824 RepID=A0A7Y6NLD7_9BURK|nr:hypothetical protein [Schlegelella koreensis]NUZ05259.1 hypothetical protein [Schlegelella koreensis]